MEGWTSDSEERRRAETRMMLQMMMVGASRASFSVLLDCVSLPLPTQTQQRTWKENHFRTFSNNRVGKHDHTPSPLTVTPHHHRSQSPPHHHRSQSPPPPPPSPHTITAHSHPPTITSHHVWSYHAHITFIVLSSRIVADCLHHMSSADGGGGKIMCTSNIWWVECAAHTHTRHTHHAGQCNSHHTVDKPHSPHC